jgi:hypothetical protein
MAPFADEMDVPLRGAVQKGCGLQTGQLRALTWIFNGKFSASESGA